jgi:hypothetical protein
VTTPHDFAVALLAALDLPMSTNNIQSLIAIQAQEGGFMHNPAYYNPLNTAYVLNSTTASGFSSPAIQAYPDWPTGLSATVKTLQNGLYPNILAALQASSLPDTTLQAVKNSPFGWYYCIDPNTSSSEACSTAGAVRVPIEPQPAASLQYEASTPFPLGPNPSSTLPIPAFGSMPYLPNVSSVGPSSITQAGVGAVLAYGFWKLYEYLGK